VKIAKLFKKASIGELELYINAITLGEVLYVASRIYQVAGIDDPNREAMDLMKWLKSRTQIVSVDESIAVRVGELKKQLRIALADCLVIASAEAIKAVPLFRKPEKEMKPVMSSLRQLGVKFLGEIQV
jgi:predicted nucleic acid-binding protein